jgi:hypothetical protein
LRGWPPPPEVISGVLAKECEDLMLLFSKKYLGGHLKTGQWWSPQNRPTELTQDKVVIACRRVLRQ